MVLSVAAIIGLALSQSDARKVEGLLVVSSDKAFIAKAEKAFVPGGSFEAPRESFKNPRCFVTEWGKRSAILIDRDTPYLQSKADEVVTLKAFNDHLKTDLTLNFSDLKPEEKAAISRYLGRTITAFDETKFKDVALGASFNTLYTVRGADGREFTSHRRVSDERTKSRDAALQRSPFDTETPNLSKSDIERRLKEMNESQGQTMSLSFRCFGIADQNLPEGLQESGKHLQKLLRDLLFARQEQSMSLAKKAGMVGSKYEGDQALARLPEGVQGEVKSTFLESWRVHGFQSMDEARNYFDGTSSVKLGTSISMAFCTSPSRGKFNPPTYWSFEIGSFYGSQP